LWKRRIKARGYA
jgi:hypothetical protein